MSTLAQADIVVERARLVDPRERRRIRVELFRALQSLGYVDSVERYVKDPPDGPYRDGAWDHLNTDEFAVVRVIGRVTRIPRGLDTGGEGAAQ